MKSGANQNRRVSGKGTDSMRNTPRRRRVCSSPFERISGAVIGAADVMNDTEVKTLDVLRAVSGTIDSQIQKLEEQDFFKDTDVGPASDHEPDTELEQLLEQEDQTAHEVRKRLKKTDKPEPPSPYPTWIDERSVWCGGAARVLYDLHHRAS